MTKSPTTIKNTVAAILNESAEGVEINGVAPRQDSRAFMELMDTVCKDLRLHLSVRLMDRSPPASGGGLKGMVARGLYSAGKALAPDDVLFSNAKYAGDTIVFKITLLTQRAIDLRQEIMTRLSATEQ